MSLTSKNASIELKNVIKVFRMIPQSELATLFCMINRELLKGYIKLIKEKKLGNGKVIFEKKDE